MARRPLPLAVRFWSKVNRQGPLVPEKRYLGRCWLWTGALNSGGYGFLSGGLLAHRVGYALVIGPIPPGDTLDHLCRRRACVNPRHLEPCSRVKDCHRKRSSYVHHSYKLIVMGGTSCPHQEVITGKKHPYVMRCNLIPDHGGLHAMHPASHVLWEEANGIPVPAKFTLTPLNGDWLNFSPLNWALLSAKQLQRDLASIKRKALEWTGSKHCKLCGAYLELAAFAPRRNACKECWKGRLKRNEHRRRDHVKEFNCHLVDGQHFHVLDRDSAMVYLFYMIHRQLKLENPNPIRYRQAVGHIRARLRRAVQSGKTEDKNDNKKT